jgi:hypothetical protein
MYYRRRKLRGSCLAELHAPVLAIRGKQAAGMSQHDIKGAKRRYFKNLTTSLFRKTAQAEATLP